MLHLVFALMLEQWFPARITKPPEGYLAYPQGVLGRLMRS